MRHGVYGGDFGGKENGGQRHAHYRAEMGAFYNGPAQRKLQPVSYTHLSLEPTSEMCTSTVLMPTALTASRSATLVWVYAAGLMTMPVSYTHLDVYKRQDPLGSLLGYSLYKRGIDVLKAKIKGYRGFPDAPVFVGQPLALPVEKKL